MPIPLRTFAVPCLALGIGILPGFAGGPEVPPELRTRAEVSDFRATSTGAETLGFLRRLEARSPYFRLGVFGTSEQGRPMPFVVVSKDRAFTPKAARRQRKPIVMLQGGIHAGEIDGKDALLLLRDLALGQHPAVLDRSPCWWCRSTTWTATSACRASTARTATTSSSTAPRLAQAGALPTACAFPSKPSLVRPRSSRARR